MKKSLYTFFAIYILFSLNIIAQDKPLVPKVVGYGVFLGKTPPLKDLPAVTPEEIEFLKDKALKKAARKVIKPREYPFAATALPRGEDAAWQKTMGKTVLDKAPLVNFEGQTTSSFPPDCNGTIGPNHYMQTVNTTYAIYNRTGTLLAGPTNMNLLFNGVSGATCNDGDPLIQYDEQAQRWVAVEFSLCGSNDLMLMAVSATSDPTGSWYAYSFDVTDTPDYEKLGIWQDGYYMGTNTGSGNDIYVFERSKMLTGAANPQMVAFDNSWRPGTGFLCVPPLDNDGAFAPAGSPGLFIAFNDDAVAGGSDQLWIYELAVNWTTPASSTFVRSQQIPVTAFDSQFTSSWDDITQPGTQKLDGVPQVIMNAPQYRNFGTYQTILCCHTVDVDATNHAGIRWYELRKTPPSTTWVVRQSGTYAPDASSRWMGSIMLNGSGKIGLAYSIASSTIYPGIRYCGQSSAAYANATGVLDIPEEIIQNGTVSQTTYNRWGDYALLSVDPTDDNTFWFSSEYVKSGGSTKGTKIASFRFGNNPVATTLAASAVTATSATLNGSLNPNGLATTYYFQWGTTVSYGNTTSSLSAGSGSAVVAVNANISGLIAGTTYHFRLVAVNADGTTNGNDLTFAVGVPTLTTVAATTITTTTAVSGGNITSDGGSTITARGVCWSTTANPTTANNKTTNGSGTGSFSSSITGLSANTTYHVRAYATTGTGTFYGDDLIFNTSCGIFTLPFSEAFTAITIPNCWTQIDNSGNGQIWQFGTMTGPILTGNYAYLNSDAYGSGNTQNADLISPALDLSSYSSVNLQFNHYFKSYTGSSGNLYYSINNGSSWTLISSFTTTSVTNPTVFNQAVNAVAGQSSVKFKWNYTGTYGYHWAIDDINITGVSNSLAIVTTTALTSVTTTTAISGGNVTNAGSSPVTARGICWGTVLNPTIADNHTTNGSGIGSFSSNISGLIINTTYHVRAYATNSSGTSYGNDIQFSTLCGTISTFPWNEGFENAGAIPACWSQEQVNSSGINWTFVAGNGGSNPAAAHTGSYNATLKDASAADNKTKLITPTLNLTSINNPQLSFWHTQQLWSPDQDLLSVYYKTSATGIWTLLTSYTNSITAWTQETITLPSPTSDYYIAFEGNAKYGYGICVDDINVTGTGCIVPSAAGAISGTTSVCQGQTITYTVSPIANATSYIWTLPNGASGTSSTNSINVNYGISAISGNITVKGNNICGDGSASSLAVTVNSYPDAAGIISGNTSVCSGQIINYSVSPIANATSYVWTFPNGASGSSATNSIDVSFSISATSGNITVKANNACGDGSVSSLPIVVGILPSAAAAITGAASVCQGQTLTYTVSPIANATSYVWILPTGANGTSTTNSIDINFDLTSASGNINVKGNNACGNGSASDLAITVNSLPDAAGIISGNETVCKGQSLTYSVGTITNAASYTWNLPNGVSGNSVTNNIDVSYGVAAISGNILVNGSNICGDGSTSSLAVTVKNIPASANSISGLDTISQGQNNVIYSVSPIIDANTYIWTLPTNSVGNSVSNSIVLSFPDSCVSGNLIVKGQNECGVGEPSSKYINVFKSLEVKLFLEGLYIGNQQMQSALNETGTPQWGAGNADKIIIELRDSSLNFQSVFADSNILLKTDGYAFTTRITASNNGKYYIVAKSRNHIETWSATSVSFSNDTTYYNFTTSADKAYGNNLKETSPDYVINLTAILADNTNNILELKSYAYNPLRYTLILIPESDNIHLKVIVIDKVLNKTYQTSVLKADYLY